MELRLDVLSREAVEDEVDAVVFGPFIRSEKKAGVKDAAPPSIPFKEVKTPLVFPVRKLGAKLVAPWNIEASELPAAVC